MMANTDQELRLYRQARKWSNQELKKIAGLLKGDVINVSGWQDSDKEGGEYRDYFSVASSYTVSNYSGARGSTGEIGEVYLDLTRPLPDDLIKRYDVVFNHTTLEHIFEVQTAFTNLCRLSRDVVILVLPFLQPTHVNESYGDYWRFTAQGARCLFEKNGFTTIYESVGNSYYSAIYLFMVATSQAEKWRGVLPSQRLPDENLGVRAFGHPSKLDWLFWLLRKLGLI